MQRKSGFIEAHLHMAAKGNQVVGIVMAIVGIAMGIFVSIIPSDDDPWVFWAFGGIAVLCVCFGFLSAVNGRKQLLTLKNFDVIVDEQGGDRLQSSQLLNGVGETLLAGIVLCGIGGGMLFMPDAYRPSLEAANLYFPFLEHLLFGAGLIAFFAFFMLLMKWFAFKKVQQKSIAESGHEGQTLNKQMYLELIDPRLNGVFQVAPVDKKGFKKFLDDVSYVVSNQWLVVNENSSILAVAASEIKRVDYIGTDRMNFAGKMLGAVAHSGDSERRIGLFLEEEMTVFEDDFSVVDGEISQKHHVVCVDYGTGYFYMPARDEKIAREIEAAFYRVMPKTERKYSVDEDATLLTPEKQRWLNVGGVLTAMNYEFINSLATGRPVKENRKAMKEWWGITNRQIALDVLESLVNTGHRLSLDARLNREPFRADLVEFDIVSEKEDLNGITTLAWDMGRLVNVARWCFDLGYISEDEAWKYMETVYQEVQPVYASWREFAAGYLIGRALWSEMERDVVRIVAGLLKDADSPWVKSGW